MALPTNTKRASDATDTPQKEIRAMQDIQQDNVIEDYPIPSRRGPAPKYPWDEWLDGQRRILFPELDFTYSLRNFSLEIRKQGRKRGLTVSCLTDTYRWQDHHPEKFKRMHGKECLVVQATGQYLKDTNRSKVKVKSQLKRRRRKG